MNRSQAALVVRIVVEVGAVVALVRIGTRLADGVGGLVLAVVLPTAAALVWGVFRVPGDPGEALVPVPGWARLAIEGVVLGGVVWALWQVGNSVSAVLFAVAVLGQYGLAFERVRWLVRGDLAASDGLDPRA